MTAQTAKERLIWILAKDHENGTRFLGPRDIAVMAIDRLRDISITALTAGGAAWRHCERIKFKLPDERS